MRSYFGTILALSLMLTLTAPFTIYGQSSIRSESSRTNDISPFRFTKHAKEREKNPKRIRVALSPDEQPSTVIEIYKSGELLLSITVGAGTSATVASLQPASAMAIELEFWNSVKTSTNPEDFKAYLKKYPNGEFADLAKNRLNSLGAPVKTAAPVPAPPPGKRTIVFVTAKVVAIARDTDVTRNKATNSQENYH